MSPRPMNRSSVGPVLTCVKISKWPTVKALRFNTAINVYGAAYIYDALARFVVAYWDPQLSEADIEHQSHHVFFCFKSLPVYHKVKFILEDSQQLGIMHSTLDAAHARPPRKDPQNRHVPARFDTVLVNEGTGGPSGITGMYIKSPVTFNLI